jgi:hypothetical protein
LEQFVGPVTFAVCGSTVAGGVAGNGLGMGVGAVAGGAVGAAVGVVSAVVGGLKTAAGAVASGVSETATLGAVASRGVLARGDCTMGSAVPYKFGDTTRGILEKGRQARQTPGNGSEKKGYRFGDFTRGVFSSTSAAARVDELQAKRAQDLAAAGKWVFEDRTGSGGD